MAKVKSPRGLKAKTPVAEAMAAILPPQVETVLSYEQAVRDRDPDGVHDMRVATKRLRESARVFRPAFGKNRMARHLDRLEALNDALGVVRELDVLGLQLDDLAASEPPLRGGLQPLRDELARKRDEADDALTPVLDRTLSRLEDDFTELLEDRSKKRSRVWRMPFIKLGRRCIATRMTEAFAFEEAARAPGATREFHRMRIAIKKVKYALELFLGVLGKRAKKAYKPVGALQELMGEVHDCDVLLQIIRAAGGDALTAATARRAVALIEADRARLHDETLALLDEIHESRVCERLLDKLR